MLSLDEATRVLTTQGAPYEMEECVVQGQRVRCWKHFPSTLPALVQHSRTYGDRVYLVYEDERYTYEQIFRRVCTLAEQLRTAFGVRKDDRVAIAMRNYPEWPIAFWAATSAGAIAVPLNAWWTGDELAYGLLDSGSRVLIADLERAERIAPHLASLPLQHVLVTRATGALPSYARSLDPLIAEAGADASLPEVEILPDDDATLFYTSGTTGHPKGALGTHRNITSNVGSCGFVRARAALRRGLPLPGSDPAAPQGAQLLSVPLFHVTGCHSTLAYVTQIGGKLVLMYKWSPERALELIERERITSFGGVPAMAWQVLESPEFERRDLSSVLTVSYGGAPAAPELVRRLKQAFPTISASNGYGLTETSALTISNIGPDYERKPDSIGLAVPISDVKVVGDDGREVPRGEIGELCVRGPHVVKGYWNKPEPTAKTFREGYLHTGDVVRMDDEGFIYVLDRAKDMLIRGGENVYCVEVENALYQHPAVIDAAVIGIPHRVLGEEVGAVVQLKAGVVVSEQELRAHVARTLAAFKVPVRIDFRSEPLPRNPNGKIMKRQLRTELGLDG